MFLRVLPPLLPALLPLLCPSQDESDQALAAYRTACRLFPGLHTPLLGMGCAYQRMNNLHLCERCFLQAHSMCPQDPAVAQRDRGPGLQVSSSGAASGTRTAADWCGGWGRVQQGSNGDGELCLR